MWRFSANKAKASVSLKQMYYFFFISIAVNSFHRCTGGVGHGEQKPPVSTPSYASTQTKLRFVSSVEFKLTSGELTLYGPRALHVYGVG